MNKYRMELVK